MLAFLFFHSFLVTFVELGLLFVLILLIEWLLLGLLFLHLFIRVELPGGFDLSLELFEWVLEMLVDLGDDLVVRKGSSAEASRWD